MKVRVGVFTKDGLEQKFWKQVRSKEVGEGIRKEEVRVLKRR